MNYLDLQGYMNEGDFESIFITCLLESIDNLRQAKLSPMGEICYVYAVVKSSNKMSVDNYQKTSVSADL